MYSIIHTLSYLSVLVITCLFSRLTDEIRDIFAGLGSTMIRSVKPMDSWVFAGAYGMKKASPFEKVWTQTVIGVILRSSVVNKFGLNFVFCFSV